MIIIARYNEDMEWTKQFPNVLIYNKGTTLNENYNQIMLNNVGREGHTYYKYIYDNYDNLDNYTIFLQGNPFDHSPNVIENINKYINNKDLSIDFEYLSEKLIYTNLSGCDYHRGIPLKDVYEKLFGERKDYMIIQFGTGAQFIVSRNKILERPRSFYLKIVEMLEKSTSPLEGYVIERFHGLIFSPTKK